MSNRLFDRELLSRIKTNLDALEATLSMCNDTWVYEDYIYRFWHHSFKVYQLQQSTTKIVDVLRRTGGDLQLHPWFEEIVLAGCNKTFDLSHNKDWLTHAKPIVDAFLHARFMLEMVVKYGRELDELPTVLPSGWAAVLTLYQIR